MATVVVIVNFLNRGVIKLYICLFMFRSAVTFMFNEINNTGQWHKKAYFKG